MSDSTALDQLIGHLHSRWPEHDKFVRKSLEGRTPDAMRVSNQLADCIIKLANDEPGGLDELCDDYRFLCEDIVIPEEIHFRRHGEYRLSKFEDAEAECYANPDFMARYMNGLLLSDVLWVNHANAFTYFVTDYLSRLAPGAKHLEIGPGHGMFLYFAAIDPNVATVTGWDVSPTSIEKTRHALELLGASPLPSLRLQNLFAAEVEDEKFDSLTMSEILEHLEDPVAALKAAARSVKSGGLLFVNVPANSPAPDHIFLFQGLDHAKQIVEEGGFTVEAAEAFPMVGATLDKAERKKMAISCVVVGRKP